MSEISIIDMVSGKKIIEDVEKIDWETVTTRSN